MSVTDYYCENSDETTYVKFIINMKIPAFDTICSENDHWVSSFDELLTYS